MNKASGPPAFPDRTCKKTVCPVRGPWRNKGSSRGHGTCMCTEHKHASSFSLSHLFLSPFWGHKKNPCSFVACCHLTMLAFWRDVTTLPRGEENQCFKSRRSHLHFIRNDQLDGPGRIMGTGWLSCRCQALEGHYFSAPSSFPGPPLVWCRQNGANQHHVAWAVRKDDRVPGYPGSRVCVSPRVVCQSVVMFEVD